MNLERLKKLAGLPYDILKESEERSILEHRDDLILSKGTLKMLPSTTPKKVVGGFYCDNNYLTSLENCPSEVGGDFNCIRNKITSLKDINKQLKEVGNNFYCYDNPIKSHILGLMLVKIRGKIITELGDGRDVDEILNKWKNKGQNGVDGCKQDLIKAGYKELAQL